MSIKIHVEPEDVWDFFYDNPVRMEDEMVAIAENEDTKFAVFLTDNDCGLPLLIVYRGEHKEYEERTVSDRDCRETAQKMYTKYLYPVTVSTSVMQEEDICDSYEAQMELVCEREDELNIALNDFLEIVLGCNSEQIEFMHGHDFVEQVLDDICEYFANDHLISIFRPTFIPNDDGTEEFIKYPYNELAGGDETHC